MKLYAVDYLLIHGRYSLATADVDTALNHYQEAKQLIEETGYHLRDAEFGFIRRANLPLYKSRFELQKCRLLFAKR